MDLILPDSEEHVMISYHWECQKTMLVVKTELESKGLRVWMDVDKMKGGNIKTMAWVVEKSLIVLIAMSQRYESSPNCRSGSFISTTEFKQRRMQRQLQRQLQRHDMNQPIHFLQFVFFITIIHFDSINSESLPV